MTTLASRCSVLLLGAALAALGGCASEPVQAPVADIRPPPALKPAPEPLPPPDVVLDLDEGFHIAIAEAGGNSALVAYLRSVNERIRAIRAKDFINPHRIRTTYTQHARILSLIAAQDAAGASAAMREHILESKANVINAVKELLAAVYLR